MTRKLFYEDTQLVTFTASVESCTPVEHGKKYQVVLNQTSFFPEGGGQGADKGTLSVCLSSDSDNASGDILTLPVLDVQMKEDVIYHILEQPLAVGTTVTGQVDWAQRFDFMQQHTGEHILSGLIHSHYGFANVGFHLGAAEVTLDTNGELSPAQLQELEEWANEVIWRNLPIEVSYPSAQELAALTYRSKLELTENVRLVTIPGVDVCACCAPHVESTGQVGILKITSAMRHRGGMRLTILCGQRALSDYTQKQRSVLTISAQLSVKQPDVAAAVLRLQEDFLAQKEQTHSLQAQLLSLSVAQLPSPACTENPLLFVGDFDTIALRNTVNTLTQQYLGYCGIFSGNDTEGYRFIVGSSHKSCPELALLLRQHFQAKGGGTAPMIQGSIQTTRAALEAFWNTL